MDKKYICSICSKELSNRHSLSRHRSNYCKGSSNPSESTMFQSEILKDTKNDLQRDERIKKSRTESDDDVKGYNQEEGTLSDGDYIDGNNDDSDEDEDEDGDDSISEDNQNSSEDENIDCGDNVKILPSTLDGLNERFNKLIREYSLEKKYEHRNELVFLLDEMLRQNGISREEYEKLNNEIVAIASREKDDKNIEKSTVKIIIQHDVKEFKSLLDEFEGNSDEEFTDTLLKIEELFDLFIEDSFFEGKPLIDELNHQLDKLDESNLLKSKLLRFRMLLKDIERNRFRVKEILTRFKDGSDDSNTLSMLEREKLLSREQADKISNVIKEGKDLQEIADIVKSTKIGNGLDHLPTKIYDLENTLNELLAELVKSGNNNLKQKIGAILDEMLRRELITKNRYNLVKENNDIF